MLDTIAQIINGTTYPKKQDHKLATYTKKILKDDARIDWTKPAALLEKEIRAYYPWPVSYISYLSARMRVLKASVVSCDNDKVAGTVLSLDPSCLVVQAGQDALKIENIQFSGGKELSVAAWLHGHKPKILQNDKI